MSSAESRIKGITVERELNMDTLEIARWTLIALHMIFIAERLLTWSETK